MTSKEGLKAMATWIAAIADNVKNPIAGIVTVLDRAEQHIESPDVVWTSLQQARKRLNELNEYVCELAEFGLPAVIRPAQTSVRNLVVDAIRTAALPSSCNIDINVLADMHTHADQKKITLVLRALLRNGFEAVEPTRTPHLLVDATRSSDGSIVIGIEDNGKGLATTDPKDAFEPFFTTKEAGTGLGLPVELARTPIKG
jgi:nitrogen fixation/metabolism regulation signal transduction histidine kinase